MGQDSKATRQRRRIAVFKATNKCPRTWVGCMSTRFPNRFKKERKEGKDGKMRFYTVPIMPEVKK